MGMQSSEELVDVANILREQMGLLGQPDLETTAIHLYEEDSEVFDTWYAFRVGEKGEIMTGKAPFHKDSAQVVREMLKGFNSTETSYTLEASGTKMMEFFNIVIKAAPQIAKAYEQIENFTLPEKVFYQISDFSGGSLVAVSYQPPSDETKILQKRAASVFDLAYRRYLDLKKAEAQAKEARLETALERVRARTMGMQKSEELKEVIQVVYEQFVHLNIYIEHTGFVMDYKARDDYNIWTADPLGVPSEVTIPYFDSVYYNRFNEAKEKGEDFFATNLSFEEKNRFYQKLFEYVPGLPEEAKEFYFSCPGLAGSTVLLDNVCLYIENFSGTPYSDEENATLMRFGKVFQQTYTRFLDLQKAEAQAREAQIEAALERVRSRTMAMHNSNDISSTTTAVFEELGKLNIKSKRCGIALLSANSFMGHVYAAATSSDGKFLTLRRSIDMTQHQSLQQQYESWKKQENYFIEMNGDELKSYYQLPFFYSSPDYVPPAN